MTLITYVLFFSLARSYDETGAVRNERFVIAGEDAHPHEFPWVVGIISKWPGRPDGRCTGSLISPRLVVTASHCVRNTSLMNSRNFSSSVAYLFMGYHNATWIQHGKPSTVSSTFLLPPLPPWQKTHNSYALYDLVLIVLDEPQKKTGKVGFIRIADRRSGDAKSLICYATGFGVTEEKPPKLPKVLQKQRYGFLSVAQCQQLIQHTLYPYINVAPSAQNAKDVICGRALSGRFGICSGDSGGPLMCRNRNGSWYLYGITANVRGNCSGITVFINIRSPTGWLIEMIHKYDPSYARKYYSGHKKVQDFITSNIHPSSFANGDEADGMATLFLLLVSLILEGGRQYNDY